jgi:hypothetical protein
MSDITYKTCLWDLCGNAGRNPNPAAAKSGIGDITNADRDQYTRFLNKAIKWAWTMDEFCIWPWIAKTASATLAVTLNNATLATSITVTVTSTTGLALGMFVTGNGIPAGATIATITPTTSFTLSVAATITGASNLVASTNNVFSASLVEGSDFVTAWSLDPREYYKGNQNAQIWWGGMNQLERFRFGATPDIGGTQWILHPQQASYANLTGTATLFYRAPMPVWTWTLVVSATTYAAGDLVYDDTSGNVYKSLGAYAGSTISDATKWTAQVIPVQLQELVLMDAERRRLLAQNAAQAESALQDCEATLETEKNKAMGLAEQAQKASPWLCRSYENPNGGGRYYGRGF